MSRHGFVIGIYCFDIMSWFVMLGGMSGWQYHCSTSEGETFSSCLNAYSQLSWWSVFFQAIVLSLLWAGLFGARRGPGAATQLSLLSMVTTLLMVVTNFSLSTKKNSTGGLKSSTEAFAAGAILTMMSNLLLLLWITEREPQRSPQGAPASAHPQNPYSDSRIHNSPSDGSQQFGLPAAQPDAPFDRSSAVYASYPASPPGGTGGAVQLSSAGPKYVGPAGQV